MFVFVFVIVADPFVATRAGGWGEDAVVVSPREEDVMDISRRHGLVGGARDGDDTSASSFAAFFAAFVSTVASASASASASVSPRVLGRAATLVAAFSLVAARHAEPNDPVE